jgi:hypothetical protein
MKNRERVLISAVVVGVLGSLVLLGTYGLFTATTQNAGNEITTGTVAFSDNDTGSALYNVTGAKPGDSITKCIKATYNGTLPAEVRLYSPSTPGPLAQYVDLAITEGTQASSTFPDCTGFVPDATGLIYSGTLQSFEQSHTGWANGINTAPGVQTSWSPNDAVVYRVQATLQASTPDAGQGASSGVHSFVWEAHSQ